MGPPSLEPTSSTTASRRPAGQLVRWVLVSGVSFATNLGITVAGTEWFGLSPPLSFAVALVLVQVWNFLAIRYLIFGSEEMPIGLQARRYLGLTVLFRVAEWVGFKALHTLGTADYRALVVGVLVFSSLFKFVVYRHWLSGPNPGFGSADE